VNILRRLFGDDVSREREEKAAEVSQLQVDSERTLDRAERVIRAERNSRLGSYSRARLPGRR
jgi:hypothetical protein